MEDFEQKAKEIYNDGAIRFEQICEEVYCCSVTLPEKEREHFQNILDNAQRIFEKELLN